RLMAPKPGVVGALHVLEREPEEGDGAIRQRGINPALVLIPAADLSLPVERWRLHTLHLRWPNAKAQQRPPRAEPLNSEKPESRPPSAAAPCSASNFDLLLPTPAPLDDFVQPCELQTVPCHSNFQQPLLRPAMAFAQLVHS